MRRKKFITHDEELRMSLAKNPREAVEYLNLALQEEDPEAFLMALQDVAKAFGGMSQLARKTGLNREGLYDALSERGNPGIKSMSSILDALGFSLHIKTKPVKRKFAKARRKRTVGKASK